MARMLPSDLDSLAARAAGASEAQLDVPDPLSALDPPARLLAGSVMLLGVSTEDAVGNNLWLVPKAGAKVSHLLTIAVLPKTEVDSGAGQEWSRGERVCQGVPSCDVFSAIRDLARGDGYYSSWQGLTRVLGGLHSTHALVVSGVLTQRECTYARALVARVPEKGVKHAFLAEGKFLCRFVGRTITDTGLRKSNGPGWAALVGRAAQAFRLLGVKGPIEPGVLLLQFINRLSSAYQPVFDKAGKEAWTKLPLYTIPAPARQVAAASALAPLTRVGSDFGRMAVVLASDPSAFACVHSVITSAQRGLDDSTFRWWVVALGTAQQIIDGGRSGAATHVPESGDV